MHHDDDKNYDYIDDKPRLRPLQSVGLCSLSFPTQEPASPIHENAGMKYDIFCIPTDTYNR